MKQISRQTTLSSGVKSKFMGDLIKAARSTLDNSLGPNDPPISNQEWVDFQRATMQQASKIAAAMITTLGGDKPDSEGWIKWYGFNCPVSPETLVDLKFRDSRTPQASVVKAGSLSWHLYGKGSDIIAYRVVKP